MKENETGAELRARVLHAVRQERVLARPTESLRRVLLIALGFAATGGVAIMRSILEHAIGSTSAEGGQPLWHVVASEGAVRPQHLLVAVEIVWSLVAIAATWGGVSRGGSMLGRSVATKLAVAALTPLALIVAWLGLALSNPQVLDDAQDARLHLHCALMSIAYAVGPFVAFLAVRRGTDVLHPRLSGAAIGAVAGAWGAVFYVASCRCTSPTHIAVSHVLPVAALTVSGALVGYRVLSLQTTNPYATV